MRTDNDPNAPPYDSVREYAQEGEGSIAGSLSSIQTASSADLDFSHISRYGPRFTMLADLYLGGESDEEEEIVATMNTTRSASHTMTGSSGTRMNMQAGSSGMGTASSNTGQRSGYTTGGYGSSGYETRTTTSHTGSSSLEAQRSGMGMVASSPRSADTASSSNEMRMMSSSTTGLGYAPSSNTHGSQSESRTDSRQVNVSMRSGEMGSPAYNSQGRSGQYDDGMWSRTVTTTTRGVDRTAGDLHGDRRLMDERSRAADMSRASLERSASFGYLGSETQNSQNTGTYKATFRRSVSVGGMVPDEEDNSFGFASSSANTTIQGFPPQGSSSSGSKQFTIQREYNSSGPTPNFAHIRPPPESPTSSVATSMIDRYQGRAMSRDDVYPDAHGQNSLMLERSLTGSQGLSSIQTGGSSMSYSGGGTSMSTTTRTVTRTAQYSSQSTGVQLGEDFGDEEYC